MKPVVIWGASGHARVLWEALQPQGFVVLATFDNASSVSPPFSGVPLFIGREGFQKWRGSGVPADIGGLVAIGGDRGGDRVQIQRFLASQGVPAISVIHPRAFVASTATLGQGCQVLAQAAVCAAAQLGESCIVNTGSSVDHECRLGCGVHIAPGARLAGCVEVGDFSLIAVGAVVLPRIRIGTNCIVGAGAVVTRDVPDHTMVYGCPARVIRRVDRPRPA